VHIKNRVVGGAILFIWLAVTLFHIVMANVSTDIINGICIPWNVYSIYALEKTFITLLLLITFFFPLIWTVFCYSRIVYALKIKVSQHHYVKITVCNYTA